MKKKLILAALLMSMAVTVFAEDEIVWEEQTAVEDVTYAESVFEEETEEETIEEETVSEEPEYVFEEPGTEGEGITDEETVFDEIAFEENASVSEEVSVFEEDVVTEEVSSDATASDETVSDETASDETAAGDGTGASSAVEGLVYTGEPQELITAKEGSWTYSLDGVTYTEEIPTGINAGEYTVYMKEGDADPVTIIVTIAKADVTFTPPVANTTANTSEAGEPVPGEAAEPANTGEEPAYPAEPTNKSEEPAYSGEEAIEEMIEEVFEVE